jgi:hypothetical protein
MKTKTWLILLALACSGGIPLADPLGTAFTYQGRLADGGQLANGSCDLRFSLSDAEFGGSRWICSLGPRAYSALRE